MLKKVVVAVGLAAIPSIALAQQQQCQLECTWVNETGRASHSCALFSRLHADPRASDGRF